MVTLLLTLHTRRVIEATLAQGAFWGLPCWYPRAQLSGEDFTPCIWLLAREVARPRFPGGVLGVYQHSSLAVEWQGGAPQEQGLDLFDLAHSRCPMKSC